MAPSLVLVTSAILAVAGDAVAKKFSLAETYDRTNFFDKFAFNTVRTVYFTRALSRASHLGTDSEYHRQEQLRPSLTTIGHGLII